MLWDKRSKDDNDDMQEFNEAVKNAEEIGKNIDNMQDTAQEEIHTEAQSRAERKREEKEQRKLDKEKSRISKGGSNKSKNKIKLYAALMILVIAIICAVFLFGCSEDSLYDSLLTPVSPELSFVTETVTEDSFSAQIDYSNSYGTNDVISFDYDTRVGDLSLISTDKNNEQNYALYLRNDTIAEYDKQSQSYFVCQTGINTKTPVTLNERLKQIWEKYLKQTDRDKMMRPYEKLIKSFSSKFDKLTGEDSITLLGKDRKVSIEQYSCTGRDFADFIDELLNTFKPGDELYDFVAMCLGEEHSIEDMLDEIDIVRDRILRSDAQFVFTKYIGGGFLGIGDKTLAERYSLKLNSADSYSYELFVKSYDKKQQFDKQISYEEFHNAVAVRRFSVNLQCEKVKSKYYSYSGGGSFLTDGESEKSFILSGDAEYQKDNTMLTVSADLNGFGKAYRASADISIENNTLTLDAETVGSAGESIKLKLIPSNANTSYPSQMFNSTEVELKDLIDNRLSKTVQGITEE